MIDELTSSGGVTWRSQVRAVVALPQVDRVSHASTRVLLCAAAVALIWVDYRIAWDGRFTGSPLRILPAAVLVVAVRASGVDGFPSWLSWRPRPSIAYWVKATSVIAAGFGVLLAMALVVAVAFGVTPTPPPATSPAELVVWLVRAPLVEEFVYRFVLASAVALALGPWAAVVTSGIAFGYLHEVYGVLGPNNALAGFVLAWAFFKSRSFVVPVALHALGNLTVVAVNTAWRAYAL